MTIAIKSQVAFMVLVFQLLMPYPRAYTQSLQGWWKFLQKYKGGKPTANLKK